MTEVKGPEPGPEEPAGRRVLVIANRFSGRRRRRLDATLKELEALGCELGVRETLSRGDARTIAREAAGGGYDVVAAAGGDGTINEVANGLEGRDLPLAIIPLGTANVVAAEIGLPTDPRHLARLIARGRSRPVHPGRLDGRRFMMMASVGLDAHAVAGVNQEWKRRTGKLAYVGAVLAQLARYPYPIYEVSVDGATWRAAWVIVANGRYYAGRFVCAPEARLERPGLHVCLLPSPGNWQALRYGAAFALGRLGRLPDYRVIAATSVSITGPAADPVQVDGDILATLPVEIGVATEPLNLIMPP